MGPGRTFPPSKTFRRLQSMARLILLSGAPGGSEKSPSPERTVELGTEAVSIGRDAANTLVIEGEAKSSRRHCQVVQAPGGSGYEVVDLKSTNGTRVNGEAIERRRLKPGDTIEVGLTKIRFVDEAAAASGGGGGAGGECYLEITAGDAKGERLPLTAARTTFGRRETNTVVLKDKMASGHHAEISRDLNGFTLRDLGSTNGTLVNGEPVTESLLVHGSRLRIGNARFVFKDPAMKDVDVAAGDDEDDGGWGMMGELDVEKVKAGGGAGGLLAALGLLTAPSAPAPSSSARRSRRRWRPTSTSPTCCSMAASTRRSALLWTAVEDTSPTARDPDHGRPPWARRGPRRSGTTPRRAPASGWPATATISSCSRRPQGLPARGADAPGRPGARRPRGPVAALRQRAHRLHGGHPDGAPPHAREAGGVPAPHARVPQARLGRRGRLVVVVGPTATVKVDDLRLETVDAKEPVSAKFDAPGGVTASLSSTGGLDLARTATVLLAGATPWARMPGGRVLGGVSAFEAISSSTGDPESREVKGRLLDDQGEVPATITWKTTSDGPVATVSVPGAEAVGLGAEVPRAHIQDGIAVVGSFGSQRMPGGRPVARRGRRKVLLGDPFPRVTLLGDPNDPQRQTKAVRPHARGPRRAGARARRAPQDRSTPTTAAARRVVLWRTGATGEFRVVTDFDAEAQQGQGEAPRRRSSCAGRDAAGGIAALRQVAEEFAFQRDIRQPALDKATAVARRRPARTSRRSTEAVARHEHLHGDRRRRSSTRRPKRRVASSRGAVPRGRRGEPDLPEREGPRDPRRRCATGPARPRAARRPR